MGKGSGGCHRETLIIDESIDSDIETIDLDADNIETVSFDMDAFKENDQLENSDNTLTSDKLIGLESIILENNDGTVRGISLDEFNQIVDYEYIFAEEIIDNYSTFIPYLKTHYSASLNKAVMHLKIKANNKTYVLFFNIFKEADNSLKASFSSFYGVNTSDYSNRHKREMYTHNMSENTYLRYEMARNELEKNISSPEFRKIFERAVRLQAAYNYKRKLSSLASSKIESLLDTNIQYLPKESQDILEKDLKEFYGVYYKALLKFSMLAHSKVVSERITNLKNAAQEILDEQIKAEDQLENILSEMKQMI